VFNLADSTGGRSANLRDIFPEPPPVGISQNCGEAGVLGVLPGIIGSMQALEVIKILTGLGTPLADKIAIFDALGMEQRNITIRHRAANPLSGDKPIITRPETMQARCAMTLGEQYSISAQELENRLRDPEPLQLIDVREGHEHESLSLGGTNIPLATLSDGRLHTLSAIDTVIYCKSGGRSLKALHTIQTIVGKGRCRSLTGGLDGYITAGCLERLSPRRIPHE
jgi:adenylyltransferase/sulfurtransferase